MINWLMNKVGYVRAGTPAVTDDFWYFPVAGGSGTYAGVPVSAEVAKKIGTVMACCKVLSETVGSLPLILYKRLSDDRRERATTDPLYKMLHVQPNPWQSAAEFWEMAVNHMALRGAFYAEKVYDRQSGTLLALVPRHPDYVQPHLLDDAAIYYDVRSPKGGQSRVVRQSEMLRINLVTEDGVTPLTPIQAIAESIGLTRAAQSYGGKIFQSGGSQRIAVKHPAKLSPDAKRNFREQWEQVYGGNGNQHKVAVLDEGMEASVIGMSAQDAQLLELMRWTSTDIIGIYRVPPHLVGQVEKQTSWGTGIEQMNLGFLNYTMLPWFHRIEQAIQRDLLAEQDGMYAEFLADALLRGDSAARSAFYASGITNGWLKRNEARVKENLPPVEGGDNLLVPVNLAVLGDDGKVVKEDKPAAPPPPFAPKAPPGEDEEEDDAETIDAAAWVPLIEDAAERIASREAHAIDRRIGKATEDRPRWNEWVVEWYDEHATHVAKAVSPLAVAYNSATGRDVNLESVMATLTTSRAHILSTVPDPAVEWPVMRSGAKQAIIDMLCKEFGICATATS